jgi:hypothetical protein
MKKRIDNLSLLETEGNLIIAVLGAIIGGLIVLSLAFFYQKVTAPKPILSRPPPKQANLQLAGKWFEYHVTRDTSLDSQLFWSGGEVQLTINKRFINGTFLLDRHPKSILNYDILGEVRSGRIIMTLNCVQDTSDFATVVFSNLLCKELLVGLVIGFDWQRKPFSGPIIFSKSELGLDDLNKTLHSEELNEIIKTEKVEKLYAKQKT